MWKMLLNAKKAHFFDMETRRSLCGHWLYLGSVESMEPETGNPSPDDCKECRRKLAPLAPRKMVAGDIGLHAWEQASIYNDAWPSRQSKRMLEIAWYSARSRYPVEVQI